MPKRRVEDSSTDVTDAGPVTRSRSLNLKDTPSSTSVQKFLSSAEKKLARKAEMPESIAGKAKSTEPETIQADSKRANRSKLSQVNDSEKSSVPADKSAGKLPNRAMEFHLMEKGMNAVCGVDEAGRGPLAGPVVAAAVAYTVKS